MTRDLLVFCPEKSADRRGYRYHVATAITDAGRAPPAPKKSRREAAI